MREKSMCHGFFIVVFVVFGFMSNAHANLREGLVGWWKFDEASGNAVDSSGHGNTGTPTGTTIVSNCKRSGCRSFNGTSDYVDLGSTKTYITQNTAFSVAFWIYPTDFSTTQRTLFHLKSDQSKDWAAILLNNGAYNDFNWGTNGNPTARVSFPSSITNKWWHVVIVYNGGGNLNTYTNYTVYLNGISTTVNSGGNFSIGINISVLGSNGIPASSVYSGFMDDFRIYNRALSAQEARDLNISGNVIRNAVIGGARISQ